MTEETLHQLNHMAQSCHCFLPREAGQSFIISIDVSITIPYVKTSILYLVLGEKQTQAKHIN